MSPEEFLITGKSLVIWVNPNEIQPNSGAVVQTRLTAPPKKSTTRRISYRVRRGDSLSVISKKFRVTVKDLRKWNTLEKDAIKPGQYITLYVDVTRFSERI